MLAGHKELELPTAAKAISTITTKLTDSFNLKVLVSKLEFAGLSFRRPKTFMPCSSLKHNWSDSTDSWIALAPMIDDVILLKRSRVAKNAFAQCIPLKMFKEHEKFTNSTAAEMPLNFTSVIQSQVSFEVWSVGACDAEQNWITRLQRISMNLRRFNSMKSVTSLKPLSEMKISWVCFAHS